MTYRGVIEICSTYAVMIIGAFVSWFMSTDINVWLGFGTAILVMLRVGVEAMNFIIAWRKVNGPKKDKDEEDS